MTKFSNAASCYGWQGWVGFGISAGKTILLHAAYARVKTYAKALPSNPLFYPVNAAAVDM
jgi:hypothetical protein